MGWMALRKSQRKPNRRQPHQVPVASQQCAVLREHGAERKMHNLHGATSTGKRKPMWSAAAHVVSRFRCLAQLALQAAIQGGLSPRSVTGLGGRCNVLEIGHLTWDAVGKRIAADRHHTEGVVRPRLQGRGFAGKHREGNVLSVMNLMRRLFRAAVFIKEGGPGGRLTPRAARDAESSGSATPG